MHASVLKKLDSGTRVTNLSNEEKNYLRSGGYNAKNIPREYVSTLKRKTMFKVLGEQIRQSLESDEERGTFDWPDILMQAARGRAMSRLMDLTGIPLEDIMKGVSGGYSDYYDLGEEKLGFVLDKIKDEISTIEGRGRFEES